MKKIVAIMVSLVLMLSLMTACGGNKNDGKEAVDDGKSQEKTNQENEKQAEEKQEVASEVEITWWAFPVFATVDETAGKYEESVAQAFMDKNPNIKIKVEMIDFKSGPEKIATAIQGGTAPDLLFDAPGRIIDYGKSGSLANLNDLFTDEFKKDVNNEALIGSCSDGKDYWMYPLSTAPFIMAYNKGILEKEGLMEMVNTQGDRTWTTDQFTALNQALKEKGYKNAFVFCNGQGGDQGTRAFISNLYSATITNDDLTAYTMDTDEGIKGMQYVVDAVKNHELENGSQYDAGQAIEQFAAGNVTSTLLWSSGLAKIKEEALASSGVEVLALPLPSDDQKPNLEYLVNGFCVFDNQDQNRVQAAKQFIQFICDDPEWGKKNVTATAAFPARSSYGNLYEGNQEMEFNASLTKYYGVYYNTIDGFASMRPAWFSSVQAALADDKTAEQAMKDFVEKANQSITE